ncbi:SPOR domain-containing protein [Aliivibrio salmonicida]|uniref:SPOR domain-containing protein n=1 Tax=Aliivibrio salmonicida TaxID=40269 RepID=UPI00406CF03B
MTKLIKKTVFSLIVLGNAFVITSAYANANLTTYLTKKESALTLLCTSQEVGVNNVLPESCPIGDGLWGRKPSKKVGYSEFWIQCGLFKKTVSDDVIGLINRAVDAPVTMKNEGEVKRCLIGPYLDYSVASKELKSLQRQRLFKGAALREVDISTFPKAEVKVDVIAEPEPNPITIRKEVIINQDYFAVPFSDKGSEGYYMENNMPWLRATALYAQEVCQKIEMNLITKEQWQMLVDSTIMTKNKWPMQLPYWGANNQGFFKNGAVRQLKNTSMLNVVCTKKTEDKVVGNPI